MCLGLDQGIEATTDDQRVRAAPIAWDGHWDLGPPSKPRSDPRSQPLEEGKVTPVPDWVAVGMEGHSELQAKDCGDASDEVDRESARVAALGSCHAVMPGTSAPPDLTEAQSAGPAGSRQALGGPCPKHSPATSATLRRRLSNGHMPRMTAVDHLLVAAPSTPWHTSATPLAVHGSTVRRRKEDPDDRHGAESACAPASNVDWSSFGRIDGRCSAPPAASSPPFVAWSICRPVRGSGCPATGTARSGLSRSATIGQASAPGLPLSAGASLAGRAVTDP
jgi:hypothetical protein